MLLMRRTKEAYKLTCVQIIFVSTFIFTPSVGATGIGSCRGLDGRPLCCPGNQPSCLGIQRNVRDYAGVKRTSSCFCDENCLILNDCCPDYSFQCKMKKEDCKVTEWSAWSPCNRMCGLGKQNRSRGVLLNKANGGLPCPVLTESKACNGTNCRNRRVSRSHSRMLKLFDYNSEVANLLPVRGDVKSKIKKFDMRWDIRRKLYLLRLIKLNKTELPDPEPYCVMYEIVQASVGCKNKNLRSVSRPELDIYNRIPRSTHRRGLQLSTYNEYNRHHYQNPMWDEPLHMLRPGQHICATCYPNYMRTALGNQCPGTGHPGVVSRWRALQTTDCQGAFHMISPPQRSCTCKIASNSFIFT